MVAGEFDEDGAFCWGLLRRGFGGAFSAASFTGRAASGQPKGVDAFPGASTCIEYGAGDNQDYNDSLPVEQVSTSRSCVELVSHLIASSLDVTQSKL